MSSRLSGQTEIGDLEQFGSVTEQILWLQVSMEESLAMHVGETLQQLTNQIGDDVVWKWVAVLDELVQVLWHVLYQVDIRWIGRVRYGVQEVDHKRETNYCKIKKISQ